jgi:hypothetical protein
MIVVKRVERAAGEQESSLEAALIEDGGTDCEGLF